MKSLQIISCALTGLIAVSATHGQVLYNAIGGIYSQNFTSLSTATNTNQTWTDDVTLPGWYSYASGPDASFATYTPQWQTGISAGLLYHLRNTEDSGRSFLGGRVVSGTGSITMGLQLNNNTGGLLNAFDLSFMASQFYKTGVAQQMQVSFSTDATSLTTGSWTTINSLTYTGPYTTGNSLLTSAEEIDSRSILSVSGESVAWAAGDDLWIRFVSYRDLAGFYSSAAGVLAITDVTFSAIPEPSTYAAIFGVLALAGVILRRRLQKN
jgi:hypothetical protein